MKFTKVTEDIFTVDGFFSEDECQFWIEESERIGYEDAKVSMGKTQVLNKQVRNNERLIYDSEELASNIWERVKGFVVPETEFGIASGLNERFRFYKYHVGQQFKPHLDGSYIRNIHEWSSYTFMIYLNENLEGGETRFSNAIIKPEKGKALIFRHQILHEGCPVLEGIKYVLRTDIMYQRKKKNES